ncbi:MAG TPA: hypothetical protein VNF92_03985 [Gemmatimonadaceae bacterium]|nr:hypothetical protein [Gemmatimonadaceae bacterium]
MLRTRRPFRSIALFAAAFQLVLPPAVAFADAIAQRTDGSPSAVHIEDHGHKGCHPGHPDDCVLCQTLSHWSAPLPHEVASVPAARCDAMPPNAVGTPAPRVAYRTPHSRGPPA